MGGIGTPKSWASLRLCVMFDYIIMFNYSQDRGAPKLLMEFTRNEQVPKLVTLHQVSRSKDARNRLLLQARHQTQPRAYTNTERKNNNKHADNTQLQERLEDSRNENEELRAALRELSSELDKLRQVNEGLIMRLKEVENSYRALRGEIEKQQESDQRRLKNNIYADVEQYVKVVVERLTLNLKQERMTPALQNKLERFLAQLMQINSVTVQQLSKPIKIQPPQYPRPEESKATDYSKYATDLKFKRGGLPSQQHYATIMQRLTGEAKLSKSYAGAAFGYGSSASQDTRLRTVYATTPQKRRRIFE